LYKIAIQSFTVTFPCVYVYNPNWFIPSIFLLSTLVPFLQVWKFCIHSCIESTSVIQTFLTSVFYPPSPISDLP
jgi:hypothetical protein